MGGIRMSNSQKSVVDPTSDISSIKSSDSQKCCSLVKIIFINIICLMILAVFGWFGFVRSYLDSLEGQVSHTMNAMHNVVPASEVHALQRSIESLSLKVVELEKQSEGYVGIKQQVQDIDVKIKELASEKNVGSSRQKNEPGWCQAVIDAVNYGRPLAPLRQNDAIPEKVREQMAGLDFVPTYKNISESWSGIRMQIKFQEALAPASSKVPSGWWNGFKVFLKSVFKVQRLGKDNLTPEEMFVRDVDRLLIEKDLDALFQQLNLHMERLDNISKGYLKDLVKKLTIYRKGRLILNMVKV